MKKVLFIGNSFSEDATRYIQGIAGGELFVRNLFIGGCPLSLHAKNIHTDDAVYDYQEDGTATRKISLKDGLLAEDWDIVSIQQVSNNSGLIETYEPYISELIAFIRECAPRAEIVFHRTWSYDVGSGHPNFSNYNCDQALMDKMITETVKVISEKYSLRVIPSGLAVARARKNKMFSLDGGIPLTRDSFHLSWTHGRYLAGLACYKALTGKSPLNVSFIPEGVSEDEARTLQKIADETE